MARQIYRQALKITSRTSVMSNVFVQAVMPVIQPTAGELADGLSALRNDGSECVYCGDRATDFDHLMPLVKHGQPTGYITEPGNMVPSCGPCNQSKSGQEWRAWMLGPARLSPSSRGIAGVPERIAAIENFIAWRGPVQIDFAAAAGEAWSTYREHLEGIKAAMVAAQKEADAVRDIIRASAEVEFSRR